MLPSAETEKRYAWLVVEAMLKRGRSHIEALPMLNSSYVDTILSRVRSRCDGLHSRSHEGRKAATWPLRADYWGLVWHVGLWPLMLSTPIWGWQLLPLTSFSGSDGIWDQDYSLQPLMEFLSEINGSSETKPDWPFSNELSFFVTFEIDNKYCNHNSASKQGFNCKYLIVIFSSPSIIHHNFETRLW